MNLKGRTAVITGGATRVGRAITLGLARAGAHVLVHYHSSADLAQETVTKAQRLGVEAVAVQADLSQAQDSRRLVESAQAHFGGIDVLVHSASPFIPGALADSTLSNWRLVMGVLVESFLLLTQGLTPGMLERSEVAIVVILDRGAFDPWPKFLAHGVAKSALWALARSLAVELAPQVRVKGRCWDAGESHRMWPRRCFICCAPTISPVRRCLWMAESVGRIVNKKTSPRSRKDSPWRPDSP